MVAISYRYHVIRRVFYSSVYILHAERCLHGEQAVICAKAHRYSLVSVIGYETKDDSISLMRRGTLLL